MANNNVPFSVTFAAGAIAGVSEILTMYPLDVVKTRFQLQVGKATPGQEQYTGMTDCVKKIIKNEGFSRLYRGILPPILMEAPKRATKFAANDEWTKVYLKTFGVQKVTSPISILTGATAGATESFVVVPFELVKIRLQDRASAGKYTGTMDCVRKIVKNEGPLALHIVWNAGYFGVIHQVRAMLPAVKSKNGELFNNMIAGTIGGTFGTILNTPFDVVKSRIQNSPRVARSVPKYNWSIPALFTVAREEGFSALYKGFAPKVLRLGPGGGILLMVYSVIVDFYKESVRRNGSITR
ncbi:putative mitochondrial 2-oxodicarboxylate carrier [Neolecta irregularis DAH-3]|uniref:Putative mitochondrial 2-oxodicarboxylate carrier n=1 Tax=Neolecta irregularis (strain DAH-3) TaxID=1198029 RepID=A0A1U7LRX8_NEOID|nr:putative mitochondrial 2-oxodicarboxylate carrier [Neolecta irregularis DAH-3]|eukprot:OLL25302.1 putative mitochondrial 2-oxodicarboxylate carrier [Neolecta irregularis DAH-3]